MHQTTKSLPWTSQRHSTSACKYETALLASRQPPTISHPIHQSPSWRPIAFYPSICQNHDGRPSVREFQSCKVQACLGSVTASRAEWSACQEPDLWKCFAYTAANWSLVPSGIPLRWTFKSPLSKRCVKSPIVANVSCVFSHWWEEWTKTKEGWRWGWKEYGMKDTSCRCSWKEEGASDCYYFSPMFSPSFLDPVKNCLALFVIVFLRSC